MEWTDQCRILTRSYTCLASVGRKLVHTAVSYCTADIYLQAVHPNFLR